MTSREQFEKWVGDSVNSDVHRGIMLSRHENGNYSHLATRHKWDAWQASREAIEVDIESPVSWRAFYPDTEEEVSRAHSESNESCAKRIASEIGGYVVPVYHGKPVHVEVKK